MSIKSVPPLSWSVNGDNCENCNFFVRVDEAEELGYFKNNGVGHGRNARLMEKSNARGREEVWRARLMDKVD
ncbi:hypothetical protein MTR_6g453060 [Medicago truncatula]|uniref:Uncharacterized protein n=1 Tax=Medicago truncatula TaxID=3880 RepID=A0A072U965_MEDTR|nr:hypothetical protein MTR_6g453060 [Medicago truncatula]